MLNNSKTTSSNLFWINQQKVICLKMYRKEGQFSFEKERNSYLYRTPFKLYINLNI